MRLGHSIGLLNGPAKVYTGVLPPLWPGHSGEMRINLDVRESQFRERWVTQRGAEPHFPDCTSRELLSVVDRASPVHREAMLICWTGWAASGGWQQRRGCSIVRWAGPGARPQHGYRRVQLVGDALRALYRVGRSAWRASPLGACLPPPPMKLSIPVWPRAGQSLPARWPGWHRVLGVQGSGPPCPHHVQGP